MQTAISPFIVQLRYSFQNASNLYLVMDYLPGGNKMNRDYLIIFNLFSLGELFTHLKKRGKFSEDMTRFYACEVVLALEYLHDKLNVIYR